MYYQIARFYDAIHAELEDDIPFVLDLAQKCAGRVLELGCGTGRLLLPLAEAGFAVTGIDNSAEMLSLARTKIKPHHSIELVTANMTDFDLPERDYGLAVIGYNTFLHVSEVNIRPMLHTIHRHLRPTGRLLIDCTNPFLLGELEDQPTFAEERTLTINHQKIIQAGRYTADSTRQQVRLTWRFTSDTNTQSVEMVYHYHYPHLIHLLLNDCGFLVEAQYGDYDKSPFSMESERFLLIAQKQS